MKKDRSAAWQRWWVTPPHDLAGGLTGSHEEFLADAGRAFIEDPDQPG